MSEADRRRRQLANYKIKFSNWLIQWKNHRSLRVAMANRNVMK